MSSPIPSLRTLVLTALGAFLAPAVIGQCDPQWQSGDPVATPTGVVEATALWDPDGNGPAPTVLVAGGNFTVGGAAANVATYDGTDWSALGTAPLGYVNSLVVYNGSLIAAAGNTVYQWTGATWQSIGVTTHQSSTPRTVALAVYQGDLVVGGGFTHMQGAPAQNIARWNGTGWSGLGSGVSGPVHALAAYTFQSLPALYVGGIFSSAGGTAAANLAAWNGSSWSAVASVNGAVNALGVRLTASASTSHLFVGGQFTAVGAVSALNVARYNAATDTWIALGAGIPGSCEALFVRGVGLSSYEVVGGANQVWRLSSGVWNTLGATQGVYSLSYYGGQYVVGASGIRTWNGTDWAPLLGAGIDDAVNAVLATDTDIVLGGIFATISGTTMNGVARGNSNAWLPLGGGVTGGSGEVRALARLPNGDIVAGGSFTAATGGVANHVAVWNGSAWSPLGGGINGDVRALLVLPNGDLLAGGSFTLAGSTGASSLARWNGTVWAQVGGGVLGQVEALAVMANGDIAVGGLFQQAGSTSGLNNVARFDGTTWHPFGLGVDADVEALAPTANGQLYAGGRFDTASGLPATRVARWTGNAWASLPSFGALHYGSVHSLMMLPNGDLIAGCDEMQTLAGFNCLLRLRGGVWQPLYVSSLSGEGRVNAAALTPSGDIVVAGRFELLAAIVTAQFARLAVTCPATAVAYGAACSSGPIAMTAQSLPWVGSTYRTTAAPIAPNALVFDLLGIGPQSTPLSLLHPAGVAGCSLVVNSLATQLLVPNNGAVTSQIAIPNTTAFVGLPLFEQVLQIELNAAFAITALRSSNGLHATVGAL